MKLMEVDLDKVVGGVDFDKVIDEYGSVPKMERTDHDNKMLAVAEAVKKKVKVVDLSKILSTCARNSMGAPLLAVAPSEASQVVFDLPRGRFSYGHWRFQIPQWTWRLRNDTQVAVTVRAGQVCEAVVPTVPPRARPAGWVAHLSNTLTLFEADWVSVPGDPALLEHLFGSIYRVLSEWDLTPLERAILGEHTEERAIDELARRADRDRLALLESGRVTPIEKFVPWARPTSTTMGQANTAGIDKTWFKSAFTNIMGRS